MELHQTPSESRLMRRFIIDKSAVSDGKALVEGDLHRHMAKVLRLQPGTPVLLTDGSGLEYTGEIDTVGARSLTVSIKTTASMQRKDHGPRITLFQGMPKGDKLDLIVQKCTELGVAEITPFPADRSIVRVTGGKAAERTIRLQRIADEASRQSGRASVAHVAPAAGLSEVLQQATHSVKLMAWEEETGNRLKATLAGLPVPQSIGILIGPEGGFSPEEAASAIGAGFVPVSLGSRILRTETAGFALISVLQFYWGDMG